MFIFPPYSVSAFSGTACCAEANTPHSKYVLATPPSMPFFSAPALPNQADLFRTVFHPPVASRACKQSKATPLDLAKKERGHGTRPICPVPRSPSYQSFFVLWNAIFASPIDIPIDMHSCNFPGTIPLSFQFNPSPWGTKTRSPDTATVLLS